MASDMSFENVNRRRMDGRTPDVSIYGPRREKTYLQGFREIEFQTCLLSYRD